MNRAAVDFRNQQRDREKDEKKFAAGEQRTWNPRF
jgi:hypothetical protein